MEITVPELSLVVLVGASGSGKSTFARKHFKPTEILASDECRALISDDENNQTITPEAFELLYYIAAKRLALGKLVVVDATNVQQRDRRGLLRLAREYACATTEMPTAPTATSDLTWFAIRRGSFASPCAR